MFLFVSFCFVVFCSFFVFRSVVILIVVVFVIVIVIVVVVSDTYESVCMCTSPQTCKLQANYKKACSPGDVGLHNSRRITPHQSCHVQELFSHKHDHNAS